MECGVVIQQLKEMAKPENLPGMSRFGINTRNALGISVYDIRRLAKEIGKDHELSLALWDSGIHEARILAGFVDEPSQVTEQQMEDWVLDFDSWDLCDQICSVLFDKTVFAYSKAKEWSNRKQEFVKRSAFVLMAALSVHDKKAANGKFEEFLPIIEREATDERNFVKKSVNWALRQIGKRNKALNKSAIIAADRIKKIDSKSAKWIASDALRELTSETVQARLYNR